MLKYAFVKILLCQVYYLAHAHSAYGECNVFTVSVLPSVHREDGGWVSGKVHSEHIVATKVCMHAHGGGVNIYLKLHKTKDGTDGGLAGRHIKLINGKPTNYRRFSTLRPLLAHPYQHAIFDLRAIFCKSLWHKQV